MHNAKRTPIETMLAERKALLKRLEAAEPYPGLEALKRETRNGIERLERRMRDEAGKDQEGAEAGDAGHRDR